MTRNSSDSKSHPSDQLIARIFVYILCVILLVVTTLLIYAVVTFNFKIIAGSLVIMVLQKVFGSRNPVYIKFATEICKVKSYFNRF